MNQLENIFIWVSAYFYGLSIYLYLYFFGWLFNFICLTILIIQFNKFSLCVGYLGLLHFCLSIHFYFLCCISLALWVNKFFNWGIYRKLNRLCIFLLQIIRHVNSIKIVNIHIVFSIFLELLIFKVVLKLIVVLHHHKWVLSSPFSVKCCIVQILFILVFWLQVIYIGQHQVSGATRGSGGGRYIAHFEVF